MPIVAADIEFRLSGGASNADPAAALGGAMSSGVVDPDTLFDTVSGAESAAGAVRYRCVYVINTHATLTLFDAVVYLHANTASGDTQVAIGLGTSAIGGEEQTIADEATAPSGVTFTEPSTLDAGLAIGDLAAGESKAVWVRDTIAEGAAASNDTFTLRVGGDTPA